MIQALVLTALGILVCVYCSGFFSGSEIAFTSCNEVRMHHEAEDGNRRAGRVLKILERFDNALSAILIGNNLVNIAASSLTSVFMILLLGTPEGIRTSGLPLRSLGPEHARCGPLSTLVCRNYTVFSCVRVPLCTSEIRYFH